MKKKSFLHTMNVLRLIQLGLITLLFAAFLFFAVNSTQKSQQDNLQNYLTIFTRELDNQFARINECLSEIVYNNSDLEIIRSEDAETRQYAAIRLLDSIQSAMKTVGGADIITVAVSTNGFFLEDHNQSVTVKQQMFLRDFSMEYAQNGRQTGTWNLETIGAKTYAYRAMLHKNRSVIAFISLDSLLHTLYGQLPEGQCYLLADPDGNVLTGTGENWQQFADCNLESLPGFWNTSLSTPLTNRVLLLCVCESSAQVLRQIQSAFILLFALILLVWLFSLNYSSIIQKKLLVPMQKMTEDMRYIQSGELERKISTQSDSIEFQTLVTTFNSLIEKILQLKIQNYERRLAFLDAEQKYTRLQIRPHFFLNAMTTIAGLSRSGKNEEIETYISALSKHIRYLFSSGLYTVPAGDELRHLENYFSMQELKYPDAVLYFIDAPEEVRQWQIPQMLIHTIVENEYKYALDGDEQLMILIRLEIEEYNGQRMLTIEIEDNGSGYPADIIARINSAAAQREDDGTRVGLWSIRRLMELMYDQQGLFVLENVEPHGALSRIRVPAQAVRQRSNRKEQI